MGRPKPKRPLSDLFSERLAFASQNPSIHAYEPHDRQLEFHSSPKKERLYVGANRSGKSVGGCVEDIYRLRGESPFQSVPPAPVAGRIVGVDFDNGIEKILKPLIQRWIPPSLLINGSWEDSYNRGLRVLNCANGSTLEFMSYIQDVEKFAGTSRHFVHLDEEPPRLVYEECKLRTLDVGGVIYLTMTPLEGMDWSYDQLYIPGKNGDPRIDVIEVDISDNPHVGQEELEEFYSNMDEDTKRVRQHGQYIHIGGAVFKKFGDHNLIPYDDFNLEFFLSRGWKLYASMDHGFNNPTAWLWHIVAPEPQLQIITFYEHYMKEWTIKQHADYVKDIERELKAFPEFRIGDPAIAQRNGETGNSVKTAYAKEGIYIAEGNNDVKSSIDRIISYLGPSEAPHWLITDNCVNLAFEMRRARWKRHMSPKVRDRKNAFEEIENKQDHAIDAARYFFNFMPDLPHKLEKVTYERGKQYVEEMIRPVQGGRIVVDSGLKSSAPQTEWTILETLNDF